MHAISFFTGTAAAVLSRNILTVRQVVLFSNKEKGRCGQPLPSMGTLYTNTKSLKLFSDLQLTWVGLANYLAFSSLDDGRLSVWQ
jgi:hypothetical protein